MRIIMIVLLMLSLVVYFSQSGNVLLSGEL